MTTNLSNDGSGHSIQIRIPDGDAPHTKAEFIALVLSQIRKSFPNHLYNAWAANADRFGKKKGTYATFRVAIYNMYKAGHLERIPEYELTDGERSGNYSGWDRVWYRLTPAGKERYLGVLAPVPVPLRLPTQPLPFPDIKSRETVRKPRGL